jgi:hypothetical protein
MSQLQLHFNYFILLYHIKIYTKVIFIFRVEDGQSMFLQIIGKFLPVDKVSNARRL